MKKIALFTFLIFFGIKGFSQKRISFDEMSTFSKGIFDTPMFDEYLASDNHIYKIGDTLKIGRPSSNKSFAFIQVGSGAFTPQLPLTVESSGTNTIIKNIGISGTRSSGFKVIIISKGLCGLCPRYYINIEEALSSYELKSFGMNRNEAILKLKEQKDLLDLGIITKEQFDSIKTILTPIIIKK